MKKILVTGGAGFIGSHTVIALISAGYEPVIIDNFSNSEELIMDSLNQIVGRKLTLYNLDYRDKEAVLKILKKEKIVGIIHFAAFKAVGESVNDPLKYYKNNVSGFIDLLGSAIECNIKNFIFSSSAAVYGTPEVMLVSENTACRPASPYGWSKYFDEIILRDTCLAHKSLNGIALRYFNVVGAHPSGKIGELTKGRPQNLLPIIIEAINSNKPLTVFGDNYPTKDGTCLRDYVHVVDLANAHVKALDYSFKNQAIYEVFNIGTGKPTTVMQLIEAFEKINKVKVPYKIGKRRPGDPAAYYASNAKARKLLAWSPKYNVEDAVKHAWKWGQNSH